MKHFDGAGGDLGYSVVIFCAGKEGNPVHLAWFRTFDVHMGVSKNRGETTKMDGF